MAEHNKKWLRNNAVPSAKRIKKIIRTLRYCPAKQDNNPTSGHCVSWPSIALCSEHCSAYFVALTGLSAARKLTKVYRNKNTHIVVG